jgi:streptogramin lyase
VQPATTAPFRTLEVIDEGPQPYTRQGGVSFAAADGTLWVRTGARSSTDSQYPTSLVRVDPASGRRLAVIPSDISGYGNVVSGFGSVWMDDWGRGQIVRVDAATSTTKNIVLPLPSEVCKCQDGDHFYPSPPVPGADSMWVRSLSGTIARIDPTTNKVVAHIDLGMRNDRNQATFAIQRFGTNGLWLSAGTDGLVEIDPTTNTVAKKLPVVAAGIKWTVGAVKGDDNNHLWVIANDAPTTTAAPSRVAVFALDDQSDTVTLLRIASATDFGTMLGMGPGETFWTSNATRLRRVDIATGAVRFDADQSVPCEFAVATPSPDALWCGAIRNNLVSRVVQPDGAIVQVRVGTES